MSNIIVKYFDRSKRGLCVLEYTTDPRFFGASGIDIRAAHSAIIFPFTRKLIHTGVYLEIPHGYEAQMRPRSGLALKKGLTLLNTPGTIDSDYRGEVCAIVYNASFVPRMIYEGDKIAQLVFTKVERPTFISVDYPTDLSTTPRASGGFGSTGTR